MTYLEGEMIMRIVVRAVLTALTVLGLGAAPAVFAPTVAATAAAQAWQPGDQVLMPTTGQTGTVDRSGTLVTWDNLPPKDRWGSAIKVEDALAAGAVLLPHS